jgi:ribosomal protein S12 methylthiotransferase accessory factor
VSGLWVHMSVAPAVAVSLERARSLVSDEVGLIRRVVLGEIDAEHPRLRIAHSRSARVRTPEAGWTTYHGTGAALDPGAAVIKAVGESIERYCGALYEPENLRLASFDELGEAAVDPATFTLFSPEQYLVPGCPYAPVSHTTPLRWVRGQSLINGCPTLVPAAYVYIPYAYATPGERSFRDQISTGLACALTRAQATYRALLEMVERDAFMLVWHHRVGVPELDLTETQDLKVSRLLEATTGMPATCRAFLLTLDIPIPVILVTFISDHPPLLALGLAADLCPIRALTRALEEACLTYVGVDRMIKDVSPETLRSSDRLTIEQQALAHAVLPELRQSCEFLSRSQARVRLADFPSPSGVDDELEAVQTVLRALSGVATDVVAVDVTTPDIDEVGFAVVRAVIPDLQPLDTNDQFRHLGGSRLRVLPARLDRLKLLADTRGLNPYPHPFP